MFLPWASPWRRETLSFFNLASSSRRCALSAAPRAWTWIHQIWFHWYEYYVFTMFLLCFYYVFTCSWSSSLLLSFSLLLVLYHIQYTHIYVQTVQINNQFYVGKTKGKNVPLPCLIPLSMGSQDDHSELGLDRNPKLWTHGASKQSPYNGGFDGNLDPWAIDKSSKCQGISSLRAFLLLNQLGVITNNKSPIMPSWLLAVCCWNRI